MNGTDLGDDEQLQDRGEPECKQANLVKESEHTIQERRKDEDKDEEVETSNDQAGSDPEGSPKTFEKEEEDSNIAPMQTGPLENIEVAQNTELTLKSVPC